MKILILVLSYNKGVFADFMRTQQETWDSEPCNGVHVGYYYGGNETSDFNWNLDKPFGYELQVNCPDDYELMHYKFALACKHIPYSDYDFIFRTNSCSYIVKDRLLEVAAKLPRTNCYAGYKNGTYVSGAGIFFTPDVLDRLLPLITSEPHGAEDVLIGSLLAGTPIIHDGSRIDATVEGFTGSLDSYHFRAKTSNDVADRHRDINSLIELHKKLQCR